MVFHPSHRPLEIATRFPQFHSPDDDDFSPITKGTLLLGYRRGHFYWALTAGQILLDKPRRVQSNTRGAGLVIILQQLSSRMSPLSRPSEAGRPGHRRGGS